MAQLRDNMGEHAFGHAWNEGYSTPLSAIIAEALEVTANPESTKTAQNTERISPREREVLRLLVEGHSNKEIADLLYISERTVDNHVLHILTKLDVPSRTAAATYAVRNGLV
jgi:DNA-binding NarL/FixJ family response regulator